MIKFRILLTAHSLLQTIIGYRLAFFVSLLTRSAIVKGGAQERFDERIYY